jgi:hypothetical protein
MSTAGAEIADDPASRRRDDPCGLRCKDRLQPDLVEDQGFQKLRLGNRRGRFENELVVEERRAFGHGVDIAREAKLP